MIFLGTLFRLEDEKKILELSNSGLSNASNTFQWNILNGLSEISSVDIINVLPVGTFPKQFKQLFLKTCRWTFNNNKNNLEVGTINVHFFKQFFRYIKIKNELKLRNKKDKGIGHIIIYSAYTPFLKAVYKLDKSVKVTLIVTDLPEYYDLARVNVIRKVLRNIDNFYIYKYLTRVDSFVLLTEQMKDPLNVGSRPYIILEGIVNNEDLKAVSRNPLINENEKKVVLYTGTLHYKYGIKNLLDAFICIKNANYELWICGSGEAEKEIKTLSNEDKRIKFFGFLTKDEVKELQQQATALINPRPNVGEYTKYSFPSKTMEYLASGKPVIMYKLDGIPNEYDEFIYYIEGDSPKDIMTKIIEVCEKSEEERKMVGENARKFVDEEKNSVVQAKKILDMIY